MNERFEDLIAQAQTGRGTETISEAELLEFNEYLATRGFGVSRMEVSRAKGGTVGLCCTNRLMVVLPLTPDGFSLQPLFGECQAL